MNINELHPTAEKLYVRMEKDGHSNSIIATAKWVIGHFARYCEIRHVEEIDMQLIAQFLAECFGIDCYARPDIRMKSVLRRPLLILMEYHMSGNYCKTHLHGTPTEIPIAFKDFYMELRDFINAMECGIKSKERKLWVVTCFLVYLEKSGITDVANISVNDAHKYLNSLEHFARATKRIISSTLRETFNWMHTKDMITFTGRDAFPLIRKDTRSDIISYYSRDEIEKVLTCVDTRTKHGKTAYFVITMIAFLGIRVGDLVNLKFSNIDWENGCVNIIQRKTGVPISWPLIDEVKFPLLDYLKSVRHESEDADYVLITAYAPYTRYGCTGSVYKMVANHIKKAGLNTEGRHMGPHSLRHSLATGMMNDNVPLSAIANILGHASTRTTEIYLTVDETHLKELSLEVPDVL
jgi:integrase